VLIGTRPSGRAIRARRCGHFCWFGAPWRRGRVSETPDPFHAVHHLSKWSMPRFLATCPPYVRQTSGRAADSRAATGFQCFLTAAILHLLQIAWREVIEEGGISSLLGQIAVYATKSLRFRQKG